MASIQCLQVCPSCLKNSKMEFKGAILRGRGHCQSSCETCISSEEVCTQCSLQSHQFVSPLLRACNECLENDRECVKMACLAWIKDSKSKYKSSQIALTEKQKESESARQHQTKSWWQLFPTLCMLQKTIVHHLLISIGWWMDIELILFCCVQQGWI